MQSAPSRTMIDGKHMPVLRDREVEGRGRGRGTAAVAAGPPARTYALQRSLLLTSPQ